MRRLKNTVPYLVGWKARPLDTWAGATLTLTADLAQKGLVAASARARGRTYWSRRMTR